MSKKSIQKNWYATADESQRKEFVDWTLGLLREREVTVTFIKADGSLREMVCTLNGDLLPAVVKEEKPIVTEERKPRKVSEDAARVFCTEEKVWRSFRWDRIKSIEFKIG